LARHHVERVLPYQPDELFRLVGDVRAYPEFIPWINTMRVWNERELGEGVRTLDAEAAVGFSFLKERFSTRVTLDERAMIVRVGLIRGPFRRLENSWAFQPHPVGARLVFDIDFDFRSKVLDLVLAANFDRAVAKLIACFESRAMALYTPLKNAQERGQDASGASAARA
jgi:coenzyme Q-binding protein COQ10